MAKRLASVILITIGVALAVVFVFALVLFLAPGLSVFGFKYIAKGTHVINDTYVLTEEMSGKTFSGSIRLETDQIPIHVVFSQKFTYQVEYYDNFNGLTNSKFDDPSIHFSKDADGTAVIKINSFNKFIYENQNSSRYVKLHIPSTIIGGTRKGETSLSIKSKSSPITFYDDINDYYDPYFRNLNIETNGTIKTSTKVTADTYSLKTVNAIKITEDNVESINATNYILDSTGGKIVVDRNVSGDIKATTKDARIQILSCKNFTASSGFGDVYSARLDEPLIVNGIANIKTTAGIVEIDTIAGDTENSIIQTKTGNVKITKVQNLKLSTTRGFVRIISARNVDVTTSSGSINVESATGSVNAKTKRGKVILGGDKTVLFNPTVESTYGDVLLNSASGSVNINTIKADVNFINSNANNIKIVAGGNLTATKLLGAVDVKVEGNADIEFEEFSAKTTIVGTNANSLINVKLLNNESSTFSYDFEANDASLFEYNIDDPENNYQIGKSTHLSSPAETVGKPLLLVTTTGRLIVYYKKTA